jgi:hypothetical protein
MDMALCAGQSEITFSDGNGVTAEYPNHVHMWEPEEAVGTTAPADCLRVAISAKGWDTNILASATSSTKVALLCEEDSKYADLITALRTCKAMNVSTVYVGTVGMKIDTMLEPL